MDIDDGNYVRDFGHRRGGAGRPADHHRSGRRGHIQCCSTQVSVAERPDLVIRSAEVSHWQSVGRQERCDKLQRVTDITSGPLETA